MTFNSTVFDEIFVFKSLEVTLILTVPEFLENKRFKDFSCSSIIFSSDISNLIAGLFTSFSLT